MTQFNHAGIIIFLCFALLYICIFVPPYQIDKNDKACEQLEALAGVGRKTANVILNTAFGHPVIAVDTHIFRISNRTGLAPGNTVLQVEENLMKAVPEKWKKDAHHLLILHGRYVCKSRKPDCEHCVIIQECEHPDKTVP